MPEKTILKLTAEIQILDEMIQEEEDSAIISSFELKKAKLQSRLSKTLHNGIDVSDHAVVRYFERVLGHDIFAIRSTIAKHISDMHVGNGFYPIDNKHSAVVQDGSVVSVIPKRH